MRDARAAILFRIRTIHLMVSSDRQRIVRTFNYSILFPPPEIISLSGSHLNDETIVEFVIKYGGSKDKVGMSWGERQIEWLYLISEATDEEIMKCAKMNIEYWLSEYQESRNNA